MATIRRAPLADDPPERSAAAALLPTQAPAAVAEDEADGAEPAAATAPGAEPAEPAGEHGRIGYGRYGRFTPLALAALLVVGLAWIGLARRGTDDAAPRPPDLVGRPAPEATLTLLDGTPLRLADLRGSVVVLNFWASWCVPCREEMPLLQRFAAEAARAGQPVAVVGVGIRNDNDADVRAFVAQLGLTYPIGRDTATDGPGRGPIELAFGLPEVRPSTVFLRPDGVVDRYHFGPLTAEQLRAAVEAAVDGAAG